MSQQPIKEKTKLQLHQELGGLEVVDASYQHKTFSKHSHEGYAINLIEQGVQKFYRSGSEHFAPTHSIILVNPDDVHTGQSATPGIWSYQGMYPLASAFTKLAADLGLGSNFAPYFPHAVVDDAQLAAELRQLYQVLNNSTNTLLRETLLYAVLTRLMLKHGKRRLAIKSQRQDLQHLDRVRQFIHDNLSQNISLESLAILADLSPFHLIRQFQQSYGLPPHAYQIQQRLHQAKVMLRLGHTVANVAIDLGFHDQSHLHRHFIKAMGLTPGYYARQVTHRHN
jgi:AraC-like DNA-binding protein